MTTQKPFAIIHVLCKDTVFVSKMETCPQTTGKAEVGSDLLLLHSILPTPMPVAISSVALTSFAAATHLVSS